jgi:hypothetical protein
MQLLLTRPPEFKPRKHIGQNPSLSPETREILEVLDVMEQRQEWNVGQTIQNRNWLLALAVLFIMTNWANIKQLGDKQVEKAGGVTATITHPTKKP